MATAKFYCKSRASGNVCVCQLIQTKALGLLVHFSARVHTYTHPYVTQTNAKICTSRDEMRKKGCQMIKSTISYMCLSNVRVLKPNFCGLCFVFVWCWCCCCGCGHCCLPLLSCCCLLWWFIFLLAKTLLLFLPRILACISLQKQTDDDDGDDVVRSLFPLKHIVMCKRSKHTNETNSAQLNNMWYVVVVVVYDAAL